MTNNAGKYLWPVDGGECPVETRGERMSERGKEGVLRGNGSSENGKLGNRGLLQESGGSSRKGASGKAESGRGGTAGQKGAVKHASEHQEQKSLFQWARLSGLPELVLMFAIPNGGARHIVTAAKLKAEGVKAGVPDIFLAAPCGDFHGLFIEMKVGKNKPTPTQMDWLTSLRNSGYQASVSYSWTDARDTIMAYLGGATKTQHCSGCYSHQPKTGGKNITFSSGIQKRWICATCVKKRIPGKVAA